MTQENENRPQGNSTDGPAHMDKKQQQQTDPQHTELKGFIDGNEELEPRLEDGTRSPDKAPKDNERGR